MKLAKWLTNSKKEIPKGLNFMLEISEREAYEIINSISAQLISQSANSGRKEFATKEGEYFSIAIKMDTDNDGNELISNES